MTLQEAKEKVARNHSYVDWIQIRVHCRGAEGDIDPRFLTYCDEAAEIYCKEQEELAEAKQWRKDKSEVERLQGENEKLKRCLASFLSHAEALQQNPGHNNGVFPIRDAKELLK